MENLGTGEWIVIGLSLLIGLFFVIGNWFNNQRGNDAMRWLRRGFSCYGELQSSRFNAPSSKGIPFQIVPSEQCPFQQIRGNLVLERRENLPLWLFQLITGKKDTLFLTSNLQEAPASDIHFSQKPYPTKNNTDLPPIILDIAIQRKSPHLAIQVRLSSLLRTNPESFFQSLEKWIGMN